MDKMTLLYDFLNSKDSVYIEDTHLDICAKASYNGDGHINFFTEGNLILQLQGKDIKKVNLINNICGEIKIIFKDNSTIKMR